MITANEAVRDGRIIPLKAMVDEAVEGCNCVKQVFVAQRTSANVPMYGRDIPMEQVTFFCMIFQINVGKFTLAFDIRIQLCTFTP